MAPGPYPLETAFSAAMLALLAAHQGGASVAEVQARAARVEALWAALQAGRN
jgi:hypothetical protein